MVIYPKHNTATVAATHIRLPMVKWGAVEFAMGVDRTTAADVKASAHERLQPRRCGRDHPPRLICPSPD